MASILSTETKEDIIEFCLQWMSFITIDPLRPLDEIKRTVIHQFKVKFEQECEKICRLVTEDKELFQKAYKLIIEVTEINSVKYLGLYCEKNETVKHILTEMTNIKQKQNAINN